MTTQPESLTAWKAGILEYFDLQRRYKKAGYFKRRQLAKEIKACKNFNQFLDSLNNPNPLTKYKHETNIYNVNINAHCAHRFRSNV